MSNLSNKICLSNLYIVEVSHNVKHILSIMGVLDVQSLLY